MRILNKAAPHSLSSDQATTRIYCKPVLVAGLIRMAEDRKQMVTKMPNPIDVHVGNRLRMRRMLVGMSQEKLGESLDVTFQQIQKYEKGSNRISASRLFDIARILDVPIQFFFDNVNIAKRTKKPERHKHVDATQVIDFLSSSDGAALIRRFSEIEDAQVRRNIVDLVKSISQCDAR